LLVFVGIVSDTPCRTGSDAMIPTLRKSECWSSNAGPAINGHMREALDVGAVTRVQGDSELSVLGN